MTWPPAIQWDDALAMMALAGLAICAMAMLWLIVLAFRTRWTWGLACLVAFPVIVPFVLRYKARTWKAALLLAFGLILFAFPIVSTRLVPVDLGPRVKIVDGETHVTLTGWDRRDYSVLASLSDVGVLQMANPDVTDATLDYLRPLRSLRELDLNDTAITDSGLRALRDLPRLERLRIKGTKVTDAGFAANLATIASLKMLELTGTGVTKETVQAWKAAKPGRRALQ